MTAHEKHYEETMPAALKKWTWDLREKKKREKEKKIFNNFSKIEWSKRATADKLENVRIA